MKALDRRTILHASTTSSGSVLLIMYARYGCIQVTSTIMTSSGSAEPYDVTMLAPELAIACRPCLLELKILFSFIDLSTMSSQKTPGGIGKH
jgi:hypothetical protein